MNGRLAIAALAAAVGLGLAVVPPARAVRAPAAPDTADTSVVAALVRDARAVAPQFRAPVVEQFLAAAPKLPAPRARVVWRDSASTAYWNEETIGAVPDSSRAKLVRRELAEGFWYFTRYGSPIAYARALEILGEAGLGTLEGKRVLDFGYGGAGSIGLLAAAGAHAVGVDVDPLLPVLYAGEPMLAGAKTAAGGSAHAVHGRWPADEAARSAVGGGYDVIVSKNTLKRGYIHPERPANPRQLVHLGVDDTTFVRALHAALAPKGRVLVYNLSPAPSKPDEPYRPWTDGRCPFPRALLEREGFRVLAYDVNDDAPARAMGRALGWAEGKSAADFEKDLFGHYTLLERAD